MKLSEDDMKTLFSLNKNMRVSDEYVFPSVARTRVHYFLCEPTSLWRKKQKTANIKRVEVEPRPIFPSLFSDFRNTHSIRSISSSEQYNQTKARLLANKALFTSFYNINIVISRKALVTITTLVTKSNSVQFATIATTS